MAKLYDLLKENMQSIIESDRDMITDMLKSGEKAHDIQLSLNIVANYENVLEVFQDDHPLASMTEYHQKIFLEMIDRILEWRVDIPS